MKLTLQESSFPGPGVRNPDLGQTADSKAFLYGLMEAVWLDEKTILTMYSVRLLSTNWLFQQVSTYQVSQFEAAGQALQYQHG